MRQRFTLVIPLLNEEASLPALFRELELLDTAVPNAEFEWVLVDDGSQDRTPIILKELLLRRDLVRIVLFSRNFGHQAALFAGLERATGDAVIFLDADLQDPPALVPTMIEQFRGGAHIVATQKAARHGRIFKRLCYFLYYRILDRLSDVGVLLDSGDFGLISRRVVNLLKELPERHLYLRGLRQWTGLPTVILPFNRPDRLFGSSGYSIRKLIALALDGILSFSIAPLRFASILGSCTVGLGFLFFGYSVWMKLFGAAVPVGFTAIIGFILFTSGVQLLSIGLIGEYIGRIYGEVKNRPRYVVLEESSSGSEESGPRSTLTASDSN